MTSKPSPGWAVELTGERFDLDDLRELLVPPFDPWVEDFVEEGNVKLLLRSTAWTSDVDSSIVHSQASRMVERLHGAMLLIQSDARPVAIGQILKFRDDGSRENILVAISGHISLTGGRARGRFVSDSPSPPEPSSVQRWIQSAETDDDRADLFDHLARADNWYDVYKASEIVRRIAGGDAALRRVLGPLGVEWRRVWQTANANRHAPDPAKYPLPAVPATLIEARKTVFKVARLVVEPVT